MRLDLALVGRGLARSRNRASALIVAGKVTVDGIVVRKPSHPVREDADIRAEQDPWVSRAAHKLIGALDDSGTTVPPRVLDAGASTGGFTQVCLERGAERVYAVDVGHGQLADPIRADPRVVVMEGLNVRDLTGSDVDDEPVGLVVGDLSFISLRLVLEPLLAVCDGVALLLVKPQFEVGPGQVSGGIVTDEAARRDAVDAVEAHARSLGWAATWRGASRLPGSHGNVEHFLRLERAPGR